MKWKLLIFTLLIGCFFYAQNIIVKDSISGRPLEGVLIETNNGKILTETSYLGKAQITENQEDYLIFSLDQYQSKVVYTKDLQENSIVFLKHEVFRLNPIIIQGNNWKNKHAKSTVNTHRITENEMKFANKATTADILSNNGEVFVQKSQLGGGSPMIRGFATNRVLITIDGISMNNAIFRSGNIQNVIAIDPYSLNNLEINPGPGSVLYGSDAIGGTMNFETKKSLPSMLPKFTGSAEMRYASASNEKSIHADVQISSPHWTNYTSIGFGEFGDLRMGKNGPEEYLRPHYVIRENNEDVMVQNEHPYLQKFTGYNQKNLLTKIGYYPNESLNLTAAFSYSKTSNVPRYDRLLRYRGDQLRSAEWYYGPQEWILSSMTIELKKGNKFFDEFRSILAHQFFTESRHDRDFNSDIRTNRFERVNVYSYDGNFIKKFNSKNNLFYGIDARFNHINSSGTDTHINSGVQEKAASRYPDDANWNQLGVYAKLQTEMKPNLNLETGLRYSYVHSTSTFDTEFYDFPFENANFDASAVTGSAGLNYILPKNLILNANFATGFRAPNIDDIGKVFDSEPGNVVVPNPDLEPEYIYSTEIGVQKKFGKKLFLQIFGYYSWLQDALVRRDYILNGQSQMIYDGELSQIQALQNAANATVYGGMAQVEFNINQYVKVLGNATYTKGIEELDDGTTAPLRHAAPFFGNASIEFEKKKIKLKLDYIFNARIDANDLPPSEVSKSYLYAIDHQGNPYVPAWSTIDLFTQYQLSDHFSINCKVENILDKLYRPYSSGISAPGRNFVISFRTIF